MPIQWTFKDCLIGLALLLLVILPEVLFYILGSSYPIWVNILFGIGLLMSLLIPLALFRKHIRIYGWLLFPLIILGVPALLYVYLYHQRISLEIISIVLETNVSEGKEFLSGFLWPLLGLWLGVGLIYVFLLYQLPQKIENHIPWWISGIALVLFIGSGGLLKGLGLHDAFWFYEDGLFRAYPYNLVHSVKEYRRELRQIKKQLNAAKDFQFGAVKTDSLDQKEIYVFVLGESSRAANWQLIDYARETNPLLSQREDLIVFSDMYAEACLTRLSVPMILTQAHAQDFGRHYTEKSFVQAFREAGFKTYWLSNQKILEDYQASTTITAHAREADSTVFLYNQWQPKFDGALLDVLQSVLDKDEPKQMIVLHTLGSHYRYDQRYPAAFEHFQPSGRNQNYRLNDLAYKDALINSYDNSIRYTDFFLQSVISLLESQEGISLLNYVSDHGENLLDNEAGLIMHFDPPNAYTAHIPCLYWLSPTHRQLYPEMAQQLMAHKDLSVQSRSIFPSLLQLAHISFEKLENTISLADSNYAAGPRFLRSQTGTIYPADSLP